MNGPTDEEMKSRIAQTENYTLCILTKTPAYSGEKDLPIVWEHGRRNFQLKDEGLLPIVCPVTDGGPVAGVGIFTGTPEEVRALMEADPGVRAGLFSYEIHGCRGFPGSQLP